MSSIKLGPSGSETTLPGVTYDSGNPPLLQVNHVLQRETAEMSDGSLVVAFWGTKREWTIDWARIIKADLDTIEGLVALRQILRIQNNWEDTTYYNVFVSAWIHNIHAYSLAGTAKFIASISVREV